MHYCPEPDCAKLGQVLQGSLYSLGLRLQSSGFEPVQGFTPLGSRSPQMPKPKHPLKRFRCRSLLHAHYRRGFAALAPFSWVFKAFVLLGPCLFGSSFALSRLALKSRTSGVGLSLLKAILRLVLRALQTCGALSLPPWELSRASGKVLSLEQPRQHPLPPPPPPNFGASSNSWTLKFSPVVRSQILYHSLGLRVSRRPFG